MKAIEECAELQQVVARTATKPDDVKKSNIAEEIADVQIMLEQLKIIYNCKKDVDSWIDYKIQRQIERMAKQ